MTLPRPEDIAEQILPLDGPHHPEAVIAAGRTISELVRRLNHATFRTNAFTYPGEVNQLVGAIAGSVDALPQLFRQLAHRLDAFAADPRLTAEPASDNATAADIAAATARWLTAEATPSTWRLSRALKDIHSYADRLGIDEPDQAIATASAAFPAQPTTVIPTEPQPSTAASAANNTTSADVDSRRTR